MQRLLILAAVVAAIAAALAIYFYLDGREYEYRFTEQQLQEKLSDRLPLTKRYLIVFEVTLDNPRVSLENDRDRINAGLDIELNLKLAKEAKQLGGTIDVTGGIRYDNQTGQFFVTDPVIDKLTVQGIPDKFVERTNKVLATALAEYFADRPIYTLDGSNIKQGVASLILKDVTVQEQELVVTLGL